MCTLSLSVLHVPLPKTVYITSLYSQFPSQDRQINLEMSQQQPDKPLPPILNGRQLTHEEWEAIENHFIDFHDSEEDTRTPMPPAACQPTPENTASLETVQVGYREVNNGDAIADSIAELMEKLQAANVEKIQELFSKLNSI